MSRLLLCIDTAGSRCAVAVLDMATKELLSRAEPDIGRGHAERLMGLIAESLAAADARYEDVGRIGVVVGPGSFTGLRVGVAAAKGLSLALGVGAVGVSSLEALAEPHVGTGLSVLSVIDAKRGELYASLFGPSGIPWVPPRAIVPADLPTWLDGFATAGKVLCVGSGAAIAADAIGERLILAGDGAEAVPDIAVVARIAARRARTEPLTPLYLRGADAKPQGPTGISLMTGQATLP
ncbi:MAG: tRNA (adenosine(37)-N6)-threonylcarbamoyltransferase complex dimerization subunit type 1 TsaB [Rhizobiaceae bacterium]|nr:tRNA (adenosine(37)-N6)-threonylcarbamoyltransferase complex dimerization subunit type 1 TsaB [Rhizobiaceae bacterium]